MILLDSTVLIDYFNGRNTWQTEYLDAALGSEIVVLGDIILAEVLQGFRSDKDFRTARQILSNFPCYNICNKDIAIKSAENFRILRRKGTTVRKTIDMLIATFCIQNDFILLHNDKHFEPAAEHLKLKTVRKPLSV